VETRALLFMSYIQGEGRSQGTLFPVVLDDLIPADHVCRVLDAFVAGLAMAELGFERAEAAETGRPGYDPRDLLKLYLYGYLHQLRSSRRLEAECRRNVELMWLLGRLYPDHKSIAEFRRMHRVAVTNAGAALVQFARSCGLIRGEWIAIDGSKFRAVANGNSIRDRDALRRYLDGMEQADAEQQATIDPAAVQAAIEKLRQHPEPEVGFMRISGGITPAYNVQTAVDAEHAIIVTHAVTLDAADHRCLLPMAEAASEALGKPATLNIVADTGYSNGEHATRCEEIGIVTHVPAKRSVNPHGLFDRSTFIYQTESDTYICPEGKTLTRKQLNRPMRSIRYEAAVKDCRACPSRSLCTKSAWRVVSRSIDDEALNRMNERATPAAMRLRRTTVEHPFGTLKYRILGHPRLLLRGLAGAQTEIGIAIMAYNLKRIVKVLGATRLTQALAPA
jgi:transposase